jgi:DNA-binding beta-propeller fold protein YncE
MKATSFRAAIALALVPLATLSYARAEEVPCLVAEWPVVRGPSGPGAPFAAVSAGTLGIYVTQISPALIVTYDREGSVVGRRSLWIGCRFAGYPVGIDADPAGVTYVTDATCHQVGKLDAAGNILAVWGGGGTTDGKLAFPMGIALSPSALVYVADTYNHRVQKFDLDGAYLGQWGSLGVGPGQFNTPHAIAVGPTGEVHVLDTYNQRVQVFDGDGLFLRAWGESGFGPEAMIQPKGIAVDSRGDVYVADTDNHRIVKFDSQGNVLARWGTPGRGPGQFVHPWGVMVEDDGTIYVMDTGNGRVQKFSPPVEVELRVEPRVVQERLSGPWVTASLEPPLPRTAAQIVASSLRLNGVAVDPEAPVETADGDGDGVSELRVKFDREAVIATAAEDASILPLHVTGGFEDRACLTGRDAIRVMRSSAEPLAGSPPHPEDGTLQLAGVHPNPVRGAFEMTFHAPSAGAARLELFDVGGRRVHLQEAVFAAGRHTVQVRPAGALPAGLYLLRLTHGGASTREARVAILR